MYSRVYHKLITPFSHECEYTISYSGGKANCLIKKFACKLIRTGYLQPELTHSTPLSLAKVGDDFLMISLLLPKIREISSGHQQFSVSPLAQHQELSVQKK